MVENLMGIHPTENEIELFLLTPEALTTEKRQQIDTHLSSCPQCRAATTLLRSFHSEFKKQYGTPPAVVKFVDELLIRSKIVELHPYRYSPDPAEFGQHVLTVLAAKSESEADYRYSSVCTLVSRDEQTLVRILKDTRMNNYRIFLIASRGSDMLGVTIRFPALDMSVPVDAETQQAVFSLPETHAAIDWTNIVAELHYA